MRLADLVDSWYIYRIEQSWEFIAFLSSNLKDSKEEVRECEPHNQRRQNWKLIKEEGSMPWPLKVDVLWHALFIDRILFNHA